jgi:hypothetical protein
MRGVALLNRGVAARGYDCSRIEQRVPRIGTSETVGTKPAGSEKQVTDGVRRLHRGDDTQVREARNVSRTQYLRMLDTPARPRNRALADGNGCKRPFVQVEHDAIAAIADRVCFDLNSPAQGLRQDGKQRLLRVDQEPAGGR